MATFAPEVQEGPMPNLMGQFHPGSQPMPDVSGEIRGKAKGAAIKEAGSLLAEGAQLADKTQKQYIFEGMAKQNDQLSTQMIEHLGALDKLYKGGYQNVLDEGGSTKNISPELSSFPGIVDDLVALRDSGKPSLLYYQMQRNAIASQWRGSYPGQRAWIDSSMERLTNEPAANKVIAQMVQDISAQAGALKEQRSKVTTLITQGMEKFNMDPKYLMDVERGKPGAQDAALAEYHRLNAEYSTNEADKLRIDTALKRQEYDQKQGEKDNDKYMRGQVAKDMRDWTFNFEPLQSHHINDLMNELHSGADIPEPVVQEITRQLTARKTALANRLDYEGNQPLNPNDPKSMTRSQAEGPEKYKKHIEDVTEPYERMIKDLGGKETFPIGLAMKDKMQSLTASAEYELAKKNPGLLVLTAVEKLAGPQSHYIADAFVHLQTTAGAMDAGLKVLTTDEIAKIYGGTTVFKNKDGGPFTLGQYADEAKKAEMTDPGSAPAHAAVVEATTRALNDPKAPPETRKNVAEAAFSQKDADTLMSKFPQSEYKDGRITTGQSTILAGLVNPEVTKNIKKLGNPSTTKLYVDSAEKYVSNVVWNEIQQLNTVSLDPEAHITFNTESGHFEYTPPPPAGFLQQGLEALVAPSGMGDTALKQFQMNTATTSAITKINMAMDSYSSVAELAHMTPQEFMAKLFIKNGMNPMLAAQTMVGPVMEALKHSAPQPKPDLAGEQ